MDPQYQGPPQEGEWSDYAVFNLVPSGGLMTVHYNESNEDDNDVPLRGFNEWVEKYPTIPLGVYLPARNQHPRGAFARLKATGPGTRLLEKASSTKEKVVREFVQNPDAPGNMLEFLGLTATGKIKFYDGRDVPEGGFGVLTEPMPTLPRTERVHTNATLPHEIALDKSQLQRLLEAIRGRPRCWHVAWFELELALQSGVKGHRLMNMRVVAEVTNACVTAHITDVCKLITMLVTKSETESVGDTVGLLLRLHGVFREHYGVKEREQLTCIPGGCSAAAAIELLHEATGRADDAKTIRGLLTQTIRMFWNQGHHCSTSWVRYFFAGFQVPEPFELSLALASSMRAIKHILDSEG